MAGSRPRPAIPLFTMKMKHKKILFIVLAAGVAYFLLRKKSTGAAVVSPADDSGLGKIISLPASVLEMALTRQKQQDALLKQDKEVAARVQNASAASVAADNPSHNPLA